jgi:acetoin utilization deacetylase AcuC-like enzyme
MILYDQQIPASIVEFGIQIPIRDSRALRTFGSLMDDPALKTLHPHWHCDRIVERLSREDLLRVHSASYVERLFSPALEREIISTFELIGESGKYHRYAPETATRPLTDLFDRLLLKAAGTVQAARLALEHGFSFSFTGGAHHAQHDFGNGFCMINDVVIAPRKLQQEGKAKRVWIIDVDAHKGDGTAALTSGDDSIRTLSIHMASGWPLDGPKVLADGRPNPSFIASDIDIPIERGEENVYLPRLREGLKRLAAGPKADLAIVVCGADPYELDELPSASLLRLSLDQMLARDQLLYTWLREQGIPAAFLMAGGYGDEVWRVYSQFLLWVVPLRLKHAGLWS